MSNGDCAKGAANEANIDSLKNDYSRMTEWMQRLEDKVNQALAAAMKRPGWAVCTIISILLAAVAVLGTLLAAHVKGG